MRPISASGLAVASVCWVIGWFPSLLPGGTVMQGLTLGILAAVGYGIGTLIGATVRWVGQFADASNAPKRQRISRIAGVVATLALVVAVASGAWFARAINAQADEYAAPNYRVQWILATVVGVVVAVLLISLGRILRRSTQKVEARLTTRGLQPALAAAAAFGLTTTVVVVLVFLTFVALQQTYNWVDSAGTNAAPPQSATRSGSTASLVPFDSLGKEGRQFVTQGQDPTTIRAYAGLRSAANATQRAELAVADLIRAGGAEATVWVGITTTGNGFIDPVAAEAVDEVTGGRAALVAIQYSTLPSWLSFLVDQSSAREAGIATYEALTAARERLPDNKRPRLVLYGESLGAYGSPAPFAGLTPQDVAERIDGALWVGPPAATDPVTTWTYSGEPPVWQPIVDAGRTVRYAASEGATDSPPGGPDWPQPRILVLQNPTDPVVWFAPGLIAKSPQWLSPPRGPGVQQGTRWVPLLFFLQTAMDLPQAVSMPSGYGHNYSDSLTEAWRQVLDLPA